MLAEDLVSAGHPPIITIPGRGELFQSFDRRIIPGDVAEAAMELRRIAPECDLIHCFSTRSMLIAILAKTGKPLILHALIPNIELFDRVVSPFARLIICNSRATANRFSEFAEVEVVYNGIREPRPPGTKLPLNPVRRTIGLFGPGGARKGQLDALPALRQVIASTDDVDVAFAGRLGGPVGLQLHETAKQSGGRIRLLGFVPNLANHMAEFSLVIVPSRSEGFGRVAVEALRAGVPVLATRVEGLVEALEELEDPWLPDDEGLWADRILRELDGPTHEADELRRAGARFSPETYLENILSCYQRIIEEG
jgi:glycosyltransferase involved in cell wall biosynthesis